MNNYQGGTRDLSEPPRGSLAARLAQAMEQRRREQEALEELELCPIDPAGQQAEPFNPPDPPLTRRLNPAVLSLTVTRLEEAVPGATEPEEAPTWPDTWVSSAPQEAWADELPPTAAPLPSPLPGADYGYPAPAPALAIVAAAGDTAGTPAPTPDALAGELAQARAELASLREQTQQAQTELAAVRRRSGRAVDELSQAIAGDIFTCLIPLVDDLERALQHLPGALDGDPWAEGVLMVGERLQAMMAAQGVRRIMPTGELLDPRLHEAVARYQAADIPEDTITNVLLPGYILHGRVLRAAQVEVAVRKET